MGESKPLKGAVICCSSILPDERNRLAGIAVNNLGADHTFDLTSAVTHLLVGSLDTPKTRFVARERPDIKVLLPQWLDAVNSQWMTGAEVDLAALEDAYKAPAFLNLKICLTGFDDLQQRTTISESARQAGAEYSGDLTRDVTHLIAAAPSGKKYQYAKEWGIKTVGVEWLYQSIERGLALDEASFDLHIPPIERGMGAWRREPIPPVVGKRDRENDSEQPPLHPSRRKLRRAASEKFGSQTEALWADITSAKPAQDTDDAWDAGTVQQSRVEGLAKQIVATTEGVPIAGQGRGPKNPRRRPNLGLLAGCLVYVHGFDEKKTKILRDHLLSNAAWVPGSVEELADYSEDDQLDGFLMTPHDSPDQDLPPLPDIQMQRVTEWWLEECMHAKMLVEPSQALFCEPLPISRVLGLEGLVVCSTGFKPIQVLHLSKLCPLVGAKYDEYLKPSTSVLLANPEHLKQDKLNFAIEHSIPVLRDTWLKACFKAGKIQPPGRHVLPAFLSRFSGAVDSIEIKLYPEAVPRAADDEVRPPPPVKPKKLNAQPHLKPVEFRQPSAMTESAAEPRVTSQPAIGNAKREHASPVTPLLEIPTGSNSANRSALSQQSPHSKTDSRLPTKENDIPAIDGAASAEDDAMAGSKAREPAMDGAEQLNNAISALLAHKQASRPSSARETTGSVHGSTEPRRRRRGILGRASSATSNPSGSALSNLSRASSVSGLSQADRRDPGPATQALQQPMPSQALLYEDLTVQREREDMIRRMGGKVVQSMVREGSGVIRDVGVEQASVTGRVRRKARETRAGALDDGW